MVFMWHICMSKCMCMVAFILGIMQSSILRLPVPYTAMRQLLYSGPAATASQLIWAETVAQLGQTALLCSACCHVGAALMTNCTLC